MPATYDSIASTTLGSNQASISLTSIPGTYTDLVLVGSIGCTSGSNALSLRVNSDTNTNYSWTRISGNGSAAASARASSTDYISGFEIGTSTNPNAFIVHLNNYSNTTTNKTLLLRSNYAGSQVSAIVGLWRSTSAITSITIQSSASPSESITSGSTLTLYGIKAA